MHARGATRFGIVMAIVCASACIAQDRELSPEPGEGTISAVAADAGWGTVIRLRAGEYRDAVSLSAGVTLRGEGPGVTTLIATGFAAVTCDGPGVTIEGIEFRGGEGVRRGVNTSGAVRIERCRFVGIPEAVALMEAPLSDVVYCEFVDCGIGVRAIAGSSPTVWGCRFVGGGMGVFTLDGSPFVFACLFSGQRTGVRLALRGSAEPILRNNVFHGCSDAAVEVLESEPLVFAPSIRNCVIVDCGAGVDGPASALLRTSHGVFSGLRGPILRERGAAVEHDAEARRLERAEVSVEIGDDGAVTIVTEVVLAERGVPIGGREEFGTVDLGLPGPAFARPGCRPLDAAPRPPVRFAGSEHVANSVSEQYQALRMWGLRTTRQSLQTHDGRRYDVHAVTGGREVRFDITTLFAERSLD